MKVLMNSNVDFQTIGTYTITYTITHHDNSQSSIDRTIIVTSPPITNSNIQSLVDNYLTSNEYGPIDTWDVSNVTDMSNLFKDKDMTQFILVFQIGMFPMSLFVIERLTRQVMLISILDRGMFQMYLALVKCSGIAISIMIQ